MELGKKLIEELGSETSRDVTARWMATYLAELMIKAERDPSAKPECVRLILELWRMRHCFPGGDPLARYKSAIAAFEAVVAADPTAFRLVIEDRNPDPEPMDWASLARRLLRHTKVLTNSAIDLAVEEDGLRRDDLVDIASRVAPDAQVELLPIIRIVGVGDDGERLTDNENDIVHDALEALERTISDYRMACESSDRKLE